MTTKYSQTQDQYNTDRVNHLLLSTKPVTWSELFYVLHLLSTIHDLYEFVMQSEEYVITVLPEVYGHYTPAAYTQVRILPTDNASQIVEKVDRHIKQYTNKQ